MKVDTLLHDPVKGWTGPLPKVGPRAAVFAFGAPQYRDEPSALVQLREHYASTPIIGCSTSGEILGSDISDGTLCIAVVDFEATRVAVDCVDITNPDNSHEAGRRLATALHRDDLAGLFVLSDGLHVNGTGLVQGINSVLPPGVVVTGGLAGDGEHFRSTWVLCDGTPKSGVVSALALYGDRVDIGHGSKGGWDIFGPERCVTRSEGNKLFELDGKPALALYKTYLGDRAEDLPSTALLFPLSLRPSADADRCLVRTILSIDEDEQSMTFAGDIPQGSMTQLMRANFDRLVEGAAGAASLAKGDTCDPVLSLAISCVGRRMVLGERTEEEVEAVLDALPRGTKQLGFYSYGELSPYNSGACDLHNQTMTLTTLRERSAA